MDLATLSPHWLLFEGRRVGFIMRCPLPDKRNWWQTCFVERFETFKSRDGTCAYKNGKYAEDTQAGIVARSCPIAKEWFQPCNPTQIWEIQGGIANASFDTLTVTPSLDGSAGGLWHGFITNGKIVGGL